MTYFFTFIKGTNIVITTGGPSNNKKKSYLFYSV